ncbi:hypothetical protein 10S12_5 [uncultured Caudovirales phage]|uniref:Uncharacterized protein n=1 Tax=uncultured Caudovirales phage TaxID=2100421 RepID=A0A2H4JF32_9CAUD|nr:hypothetical protein 10S12_5 [uncultured Caudovirales phage]
MQIIEYKIEGNILTVGFKEDNFVVYSQIAHDNEKSKQELLQKAYEQCKSSIDYEKTLEEHSITTDKEGEEFIPQGPYASKLEIDFNSLTGKVLDQYNDLYSPDIIFCIEGTDKAKIRDNIIIEESTEQDVEYYVVAKYMDLEERQKRIIYAPRPQEPNKIEELEKEICELQSYIIEKEYKKLLQEV